MGRAGHGVHRTPKGRIFPLTLDELVEAAALVRSIRAGILDRTPQPGRHTTEADFLAELVRKGLARPAKIPPGDPPPRKPVMSFDELMRDLDRDREDR